MALTPSSTDIDICARALVLVGANPISSFTDGTTEALIASNTYEDTIRSDLTMCRWRFATGQKQLSRLTDAPLGRFDAAYQVPSDALMINAITVADNLALYDRYEDMLYLNATSNDVVIADYIFRADESNWPPYFVLLAQFHMASIFAAGLARNDGMQNSFLQQYAAQLRMAKSLDAQAQSARKLVTNRFRNARNAVGTSSFRTS